MPAVTVALPQPRVPVRLRLLAAAFLALTLATVLGLVLGLVGAPSASAHDQLVSSEPADGQSVEAPESVLLTFASAPLETGAQIVVTGPDGAPVAAGAPAVDAAGATVKAALPADLAGGAYTVAWHVVSGDGHPIEGTFGFTVTAPAAQDGSAAAPSAAASSAADVTPETEAGAASSGSEDGAGSAGLAADDGDATVPGVPDGAGEPWVLLLALAGALAAVVVSLLAVRRKITQNEELREASRRSAEPTSGTGSGTAPTTRPDEDDDEPSTSA